MKPQLQYAIDLVEAAKQAAASGDHLNAEELYQDAIAAFSKSETHSREVEAYIGLADTVDARGGDSTGLRALAKIMAITDDKSG